MSKLVDVRKLWKDSFVKENILCMKIPGYKKSLNDRVCACILLTVGLVLQGMFLSVHPYIFPVQIFCTMYLFYDVWRHMVPYATCLKTSRGYRDLNARIGAQHAEYCRCPKSDFWYHG